MKKFKFEVEMIKRVYVEIEVERPDDWDTDDFEEDMNSKESQALTDAAEDEWSDWEVENFWTRE